MIIYKIAKIYKENYYNKLTSLQDIKSICKSRILFLYISNVKINTNKFNKNVEDLYIENDKFLRREIKENLNKSGDT